MRCCVPYCNNVLNNDSKSRGISFHTLPSKISRREAWIKALCISKSNMNITASVCSEHFAKELINVGANGIRRLRKDAVPLSVQVCLICLDTESVLCTLNQFKLEMVYETFTGLSLSNSHVDTICSRCAQRLREYSRFREECLRSNQLVIELVEKQSLTVQKIREIKQQFNQKNIEIEHKTKENDTQTDMKLNALHETIDLKFEISEEIYDINSDNGSDYALQRNYETGEINHEHTGDLCAEYDTIVNSIEVDQNETETYAPYIEVESIEGVHALKHGKIIQNVMGKSRDKINIYLRRNEDDTVEIYVIENKETDKEDETEMSVTSNEVEKAPDIHALEKKTVEQKSHISNVGGQSITVEDEAEEMMAEDNVEERTIKVERSEAEISSHNEVDATEVSELHVELPLDNAMVTNEGENESIKNHKKETDDNEVEEDVQIEKESTENIESQNNLESKMRDLRNETIELLSDVISERRVRENESEMEDGVEIALKCAICSETLLNENSYEDHMKGCAYEDSYQRRIKKSGSFILKFDETVLKKIAAKFKEKPSQINSLKRPSTDSDEERDNKRRKREVRLRLSFTSDSSESIGVRTSNFAGRLKYRAKSFICDDCDYRCTTKKLLNQHILIHTGQKPYSCYICEYKCAQKSHLDQHIRTHTGVKPYFCKFCEYRCTQKSQLDQHLRRHTGLRPYSCSYCEYTCSQMCHLDQHIRIHTGKRPYVCKFCKHKFVQKSGLLKHLHLHEEES